MNGPDILVGVLALAIVIAALVIALVVARAQARLMRRAFVARLTNDGNVPSRYEVWAEPVGGAGPEDGLVFEFRLNGIPLAPDRPQAAATRSGVMSSTGRAAGAAVSAGSVLGDALDTLGHFMPGSAGAQLGRLSRQMRAGQAAVDRAERSTYRYRRLVSPGAQAAAAQLVGERPSHALRAEPGESIQEASGPGQQATLNDVLESGAARTPAIQPGQSLSIELIVKPLIRHRAHDGWFVVCSRSLETPEMAPVSVEAGARFGGLSGFRFFLPYAIIAIVAVVLIVFLLLSARGV